MSNELKNAAAISKQSLGRLDEMACRDNYSHSAVTEHLHGGVADVDTVYRTGILPQLVLRAEVVLALGL